MPSEPTSTQVLVVCPQSPALAPPSFARLEVLYDALEAQGDTFTAEWLAPTTPQRLADRLAGSDKPVDIVCLYAGLDPEPGIMLNENGRQTAALAPTSLDTMILKQLCRDGGVSLIVLMARGKAGQTDVELASMVGYALSDKDIAVLLLDAHLPIEPLILALNALVTGLAGGNTLAQVLGDIELALAHDGYGESYHGIKLFGPPDVRITEEAPALGGGVGKIVRFPGGELLPAWRRLAVLPETGGMPADPERTFVGRTRERLLLDGALWPATGGAIWVHGYAGTGRTRLVTHVGRWLARTGRFEQVVYTSFGGGGMSEWALYDLGRRLLGPDFDPRSGSALEQILEALAQIPTLVIWDRLEALLPDGTWPLAPEPLSELVQLGKRLSTASPSRLCLVSDTLTLPKVAQEFGELSLVLEVGGLQPAEALALVAAKAPTASGELADDRVALVDALGGHPMALTVLSPFIAQTGARTVLEELETIVPGLRSGEARQRNQALDAALVYLLRSFDEAIRLKLPRLGLLADGGMQPMVLGVVGLDDHEWAECSKALEASGVIELERLPGFKVPFLRMHPALTDHLRRRLPASLREKAEREYYGRYLGLAQWLAQAEERSVDMTRFMARHELPNLRRTLQLMLGAQQLNIATGYARLLLHFAHLLGFTGERNRLQGMMAVATQKAIPREGPLGRPGVQLMLAQGEQLLAAGRVPEAGVMLQELVQRISNEKGLDYDGLEATLDRAAALHLFGRCLQTAGRLDMVLGVLSQGASLLADVKQNEEARRLLLAIYEDLAASLSGAMQFDRAQDICAKALELAKEFDDQRSMGTLYTNLGRIAVARKEPQISRGHLATALGHFQASDDLPRMIGVLTELGALARQTGELDEAEEHYQRSLEMARQSNNVLAEAQTLVYLAQVAQQADRIADAREYYALAIGIYHDHNMRPPLVGAEMALAELCLLEGASIEARAHAEAARGAAESINADAVPWSLYGLLQRVAEAEGNADGVAMWRERAQDAFATSPEAEGIRRHWAPLIKAVADSCRGAALDMTTVEMVEKLEEAPQWQQLGESIWRILNGERGKGLYAESDYVDALVLKSVLQAIDHPPSEEEESDEA